MYDILIVDDEELIRTGIIARIRYLKLNVGNIYQASSGAEALDVVRKKQIDIVLTDICMPEMDGIQLVREAKRITDTIRFMIFSGHAEFEYARNALALGVKSYLLKPLSNEELKMEFQKLTAEMEEQKKIKHTVQDQRRLKRELKEYLLEQEMNALLTESSHRSCELNKQYETIASTMPGLLKNSMNLRLAVINIEQSSYKKSKFMEADFKLLQFAVKNVFDEIETKCLKRCVINLSNKNQLYAVFYTADSADIRREIERLFLKMQAVLMDQLSVIVTMGVSGPSEDLSEQQAREAKVILEQRIVYGAANIYFFEDGAVFLAEYFPSMELNQLERYMKKQNAGKIREVLSDIFSDAMTRKYGASYCRVMWARILNILLGHFDPKHNPYGSLEKILMGFQQLDEFETVKEMEECLWKIILECIQFEKDMESDAGSKIQIAVHYIENHYAVNFSINELAERLGMSPNYFSTMFKKATQQSTINYINGLRIQKAMEYLKNSDRSVVEIAGKVGFDDSQYFFRVFKKTVGETPLQYRRNSRL